jgi:hypothetical protein
MRGVVSGVEFVTLCLRESLSSPMLTSLPMRVLLEMLSRPRRTWKLITEFKALGS